MTRHPRTGQALAAEEPGSSSTRTQPYLNVPQDDDHDEHAIESGFQRLELEHETTIDSYKTGRSSRPFADGFRSVRDKLRGGFGSGSGSSRVLPRFGFEGGVGARDFLVWDGKAKYIVMSFLWFSEIATCIIGLVLPPGPTCNDGTFRNRKPPLIIAYMIIMIVCSALALPFSLYLSFIPRFRLGADKEFGTRNLDSLSRTTLFILGFFQGTTFILGVIWVMSRVESSPCIALKWAAVASLGLAAGFGLALLLFAFFLPLCFPREE